MFVEAGEVVGTTTVGPQTPGTLNIVGVGFDERFNPEAGNQFKCEYNGAYRPAIRQGAICVCTIRSHTYVGLLG